MRTRLIGTLVTSAVILAACGGGGDQGEVADMFIELAEEEGIELDRDCVVDAAKGLSDEDAEKIVEAGLEGDADVSDEAGDVGRDVFRCVDLDSYRDTIVEQFENDDSIDADCFGEELKGANTVEELDEMAFDAALACSN